MNIWQCRSNNTLPSIPLQGYIRKLVEEVQRIFTHRLFPSYINTANMTKTPESFYDVFNVLESLLNNDEFILCNLKQRITTEVKVRQEQVTQSTFSFLESVPFDADNTMFINWSHSVSFLEAIGSQTNQEEAQEKKSSEADAYRKISKLVRRPLDQIQVAAAICSFKHLKATLQRFFGMVQAKEKLWTMALGTISKIHKSCKISFTIFPICFKTNSSFAIELTILVRLYSPTASLIVLNALAVEYFSLKIQFRR